MLITMGMKPLLLTLLLTLLPLQPAHATFGDNISMYAVSLVGSPYRLGGTSPETGVDCSGFVGHVFRQAAGIQLPRDSFMMSDATQPLTQEELQPGDLVFFNTLDRPFSHVGIYLGEGRFVHASSSRSGRVMISRLDDRYWRQRFDGARRIPHNEPTHTADAKLE